MTLRVSESNQGLPLRERLDLSNVALYDAASRSLFVTFRHFVPTCEPPSRDSTTVLTPVVREGPDSLDCYVPEREAAMGKAKQAAGRGNQHAISTSFSRIACFWADLDGPTALRFSRARSPARGCATRSVAQKRGAEAPGQRTSARRLLARVGPPVNLRSCRLA
jgi:hypothetical protein